MMRKFLKMVLKIFAVLLVLLMVAILVLVVINWGDEELRPEVKQALNWQVPADTFEDNGYLVLLGLDSPIEQDAYQVGKARLEAELARYQTMQQTHKEPPIAQHTEVHPYPDRKESQCKYIETQNCVEFYVKQDAAKLALVVASQKRLMDRFYAIQHSKNYIEAMPPIPRHLADTPSYQLLVQASELERIQAISEIANGKLDIGVNRLISNAMFSRRLLENSNSLISHMVALNMVQRDVRIISELMVKYPKVATERYYNTVSKALSSISQPEYSLAKSLAFERNVMLLNLDHLKYASVNDSAGKDADLLDGILRLGVYQANATNNLFYQLDTLRLRLADADPQQLDSVNAEVQLKRQTFFSDCYNEFFCIKNPIGKILALVPDVDYYEEYIERHHDTEGYIRLVSQQLQLSIKKTPKDKLAEVLPTLISPFNPYTKQVMRLDAEKGLLIFDGRQPSNVNFKRSNIFQVPLP